MGRAQTFRPEGQEPLLCREARGVGPLKSQHQTLMIKVAPGPAVCNRQSVCLCGPAYSGHVM